MAFGEMTVTLQDCQMMLGLRIHGRLVTGQCRSQGWRARVEAFLGREVGEQGACTSGVLISWLRAEFAQCPLGEDDQTVQYYCRAWILHLFGCVLFPDGMGSLRHRCGSTSSLTGIRRVTTVGALQCQLSFTVSFARRVGGLHSQPHLVGVCTHSSCGCGQGF
jgi:hypothetical protein